MKQNQLKDTLYILPCIQCKDNDSIINLYFEYIKPLIKNTISKTLQIFSFDDKNNFQIFTKSLPIISNSNIDNNPKTSSLIIICCEKKHIEIKNLISKLQKKHAIKILGNHSSLFKFAEFKNHKFFVCEYFIKAQEKKEIKKFIHNLKLTEPSECVIKKETYENNQITLRSSSKNILSNLFVRKNEEEVLKNIVFLDKELKYVNNIPQVIINYEYQNSTNLIFTIILLRILKKNSISIERHFLLNDTHLNFLHDDIKITGILKKRYKKESNVFKVSLEKKGFYRKDLSLDLQKARLEVYSELKKIIGEFRDYNGGLIEKQIEAFNNFKDILNKNIRESIEIDNFFHSIHPSIMQIIIKNSILKKLFFLANQIKIEKDFSIETISVNDYFLIVIGSSSNSFKEKIGDLINTLENQFIDMASCSLNKNSLFVSGYIIKCTLEKHVFLYDSFLKAMNTWAKHYNLSKQLNNDMQKLLAIFSDLPEQIKSQKKTKRIKNKLRISLQSDPLTLDPRKNGDIFSSSILFMLFSGLTEFQEDGSISLALAKKIKVSKNKKTYIFYLKDNIKWSDGKEITAYDFEKSWKKILDPNFLSPCKYLLYPILNAEKASKGKTSINNVGITSVNDKMLEISLKHPTPYLLSITSFCSLFPVPNYKKLLDKNELINNGPFILKKWTPQKEIILKKNPYYWNSKEITLDSIHISIINDDSVTLKMFENKKLDWAGGLLSPLPKTTSNTKKKLNKDFKEKHIQVPIGGTTFCVFNVDKFPFNSKNIRKAFGLAINRKKIVKKTNKTTEQIATRCIPPVIMNNKNSNLIQDNNLEKAKFFFEKGLQELKISKKDIILTFSCSNEKLYKLTATIIKETWEKTFDIKVNIECLTQKSFHKSLNDFQVSLYYWIVQYSDPINILERFKNKIDRKNYSNWENEEYIKLLDKANSLSDLKKRELALEKAEKIFIEEMPISPIYHHQYLTKTRSNIKGIFVGPLGEIHFNKARILKK